MRNSSGGYRGVSSLSPMRVAGDVAERVLGHFGKILTKQPSTGSLPLPEPENEPENSVHRKPEKTTGECQVDVIKIGSEGAQSKASSTPRVPSSPPMKQAGSPPCSHRQGNQTPPSHGSHTPSSPTGHFRSAGPRDATGQHAPATQRSPASPARDLREPLGRRVQDLPHASPGSARPPCSPGMQNRQALNSKPPQPDPKPASEGPLPPRPQVTPRLPHHTQSNQMGRCDSAPPRTVGTGKTPPATPPAPGARELKQPSMARVDSRERPSLASKQPTAARVDSRERLSPAAKQPIVGRADSRERLSSGSPRSPTPTAHKHQSTPCPASPTPGAPELRHDVFFKNKKWIFLKKKLDFARK